MPVEAATLLVRRVDCVIVPTWLIKNQEFKKYTDINGQRDHTMEGDILELSDFFRVPNRPQAFRVMDFLGIFRDEHQGRFGFVYQPPTHIENIRNNRTISGPMAQVRVPESLLDMLGRDIRRGGSSGILPLGQRFSLARALAQSLYVLHATGWVHKKWVSPVLAD